MKCPACKYEYEEELRPVGEKNKVIKGDIDFIYTDSFIIYEEEACNGYGTDTVKKCIIICPKCGNLMINLDSWC